MGWSDKRAAWLINFMAHDFTWAGHIAYTVGLMCLTVQSSTFRRERPHTKQPEHSLSAKEDEDEDEGSEFNIGF